MTTSQITNSDDEECTVVSINVYKRNSFTNSIQSVQSGFVKDKLITMTRTWDKEKIKVPTGIEPMTARTLGRRSIHWAMRTMSLCVTSVLHTARISTVEIIVSSDKLTKKFWSTVYDIIFGAGSWIKYPVEIIMRIVLFTSIWLPLTILILSSTL